MSFQHTSLFQFHFSGIVNKKALNIDSCPNPVRRWVLIFATHEEGHKRDLQQLRMHVMHPRFPKPVRGGVAGCMRHGLINHTKVFVAGYRRYHHGNGENI